MPAKRVSAIAYARVKNADGSYMTGDNGKPSYARMHTPASKVHEVAAAARKRKSLKLVREGGGNIEAVADEPIENVIEYLCAITTEFINVDTDIPNDGDKAAYVRAVLSDPGYGYIRDHLDAVSKEWGDFLAELPIDASSTPANSAG